MLKPQKKITKKELKEDKFVETAMNVQAYINDNLKQVTAVVTIVLAVFALIMVYNYVHGQTVSKSATLLGEAQLEYQNLNYTKARNLLNRLIEDYSGTDAAAQGQFLLGNLNYQQEKYDEAAAEYLAFADAYSGSDILVSSAYAGYAACMEKLGKYDQAISYYIKAQGEAPDFVEAANYLYLAALNCLNVNDLQKARELFTQIREDYKDSPRDKDAQAKLILIAQN